MRNIFLSLSLLTILSSCVPLVKEDDPNPNNNTNTTTNTTTTTSSAAWQSYKAIDARALVRAIHSTPTELFILTDNQFFRIDFEFIDK